MFNTIHYILFSYILDCLLDELLVLVMNDANHLLCPEAPELLLDFTEDRLDRVEVRLIR